MNKLDDIEKEVKLKITLREYKGDDRVVLASEKNKEVLELSKLNVFRAHTGLTKLDECIEGFRKGQLVIVSGPPKNGKTALAQTFTKKFVEKDIKCLWFSYELGYEEIFAKFPMDNLSFYVPNHMRSGNLDWIEQRIIEAKEKFNTEIVFIDNLDFLRDPQDLQHVNLNLSSYVGAIVQRIKRIAVEQNLVIFLLSHIRKNKWTSNDLPSSEELRDTGQTAQLADLVLMVIRKRPKNSDEDVYDGNRALVGVMENRHNGKTKKIPMVLVNKEFLEEHETGIDTPRTSNLGSWDSF